MESRWLAHLLRRAGFGATAAELAAARTAGYQATAAALVAGLAQPDPAADAVPVPALSPPAADRRAAVADPAGRRAESQTLAKEKVALVGWWLARMVASTNPLREKLTFLLHGHFPTAVSKVRYPAFMYGQNQLFRTLGAGDFTTLTQAVASDPAMLIWLDAASDRAADPNENFARELMERFTMGLGTFTEADVRAAAYCFTGWRLDLKTGTLRIDQAEHSTAPQTVLGQPSVTTGAQVVDIVTTSAASARYVPAAFWSHLAYPVPVTDPVVSDLAVGYAEDRTLAGLLRAIFTHPRFTSTAASSGLVKQPVEYVVGALRAMGVAPATVAGKADELVGVLAGLGQIPFDPPSVGGWPQNGYWLSTAAALTRWRFAEKLAGTADLSAVADEAPGSRAEAVAALLSVDRWSDGTAAVLARAAGRPTDLVTMALISPEFVTN